jgi:hypothetical protein
MDTYKAGGGGLQVRMALVQQPTVTCGSFSPFRLGTSP